MAPEKTHEFVRDTLHLFACRGQPHRSSGHSPHGTLGLSCFNRRLHDGPDHESIGHQDYRADPQLRKRAVAAIESF
jgi:hypothetical protein